jgi:predicted dehydrogenase
MTSIGIIGTRGHYGRVLTELAEMPDVRVSAICDGGDTAEPLAEWCRAHNHDTQRFADHRQMLNRARPDAVVVCGPFELHATMCIDAIQLGVPVLTEKPAALTFEDLDKLRAACGAHAKVHLAGMMFSRYDPGFFTAKQLISQGAIGDVRLINARKSYKLGQRAAYYHDRATYGGTIPWVGSHAIDWVMWMTKKPFTSVFATHSAVDNQNNGTMERSAQCMFTFDDDVCATVSIDFFRPAKAPTHGDDWIRIVGTKGVIEARPSSMSLINDSNDGSTPVAVGCDRKPLRDFFDHIAGRSTALVDTRSTLALTDACLRARQSADEHRVISFPK